MPGRTQPTLSRRNAHTHERRNGLMSDAYVLITERKNRSVPTGG